MKTAQFESGSLIFRQGDLGDFAYVVKSGLVQILKQGANGASVLGLVGPGGLFGEMALIDSAPRMASAVAMEPTSCIVVPSGAFEVKVGAADPLTKPVIGVLMRNLRSLAEQIDDLRDVKQPVSSHIDVPSSLPERPRAALQRAFEVADTPLRSARLALDALRAMLNHIGEAPMHGDTLFDQVRRTVSNRKLPRVVLETADTLSGLGIDRPLGSPVWDNPEQADEEATHLRQFVMHVAQLLYATPGLLAALRDTRRGRSLDAGPAGKGVVASVRMPRKQKGFYGNRFSARECRRAG
jgi:CRP-like cAMP-binding protein